MGEMSVDELTDQVTTTSSTNLATFGSALKGTGGETWQLYEQLSKMAAGLPGLGLSAAGHVEALRSDTQFPHEHKMKLVAGVLQGATDGIYKSHAEATDVVNKLKEKLVDGTLPHIQRDASERLLLRQELGNVFAGHSDRASVARARLGMSAAHDAELLGDYGKTLLGKEYDTFRTAAADHYSKAPGGTDLQAASRRALQAFHEGKIVAIPTAYETAARMHLRRVTG